MCNKLNSMNPKVLIGVVTASQKDYCVEEFKEQLKGFTYDNYDVLIIDNSENPAHIETFKEFEVEHLSRLWQDGTYKRGNEMLAECQNRIRTKFLEGEYEYLFILESDVFVSKDWIQYAVSFSAPVYTATYMVKTRYNIPAPCVQYLHKLSHRGFKRVLSNTLMLPPRVTFPAELKPITHFKIGENMCLTHTGVGCTLIRRDVVQYVPFRIDLENDMKTGKMTFSDTFFYTDCLIKRIEVLFDNRYICEHKKEW